MAFIFSVTPTDNYYSDQEYNFWFEDLDDLPKNDNLVYHIYPVYFEKSERFNLTRERIYFKNGWKSKYFLLFEYLKNHKKIDINHIYITGKGEKINVFLNLKSFVAYNIEMNDLIKINF